MFDRIRSLIRQINVNSEYLKEIKRQNTEVLDILSTIDKQTNPILNEIRERIIHIEEKQDGVGERLWTIEAKENEMIERLQSVEGKEDGIVERLQSIESKEDGIVQRLQSIESKENDVLAKWDKTGNVRIKLKGLN